MKKLLLVILTALLITGCLPTTPTPPEAVVPVSAISVTTNPVDVTGVVNNGTVTVTLATATAGAEIRYTTDGSTPTASSTLYSAPFSVTTANSAGETKVVKAIGIKAGYTNSEIAEKAIVFSAVALKEITSFTPLTAVDLATDENLVDLAALKLSGKLPTTVTVTDGTTPADATIIDWTGTFDGTTTGDYTLTAVWTMPTGYVDATDPITVTITVTVSTAQTVALALGPAPVLLGLAGNFVILAKSEISTTGTTAVVGDMGLSPAAASYITGFGLIMDASNEFSTSSLVTGKIYAADYAPPTPAKMTTAVSDMETAFTDAAGRSLPDFTELYAGDISGQTLVPGLYKWGTGVLITSAGVTLSGGANDVWIFQIAQDLTVSNSAMVTLSGGAQAKNIFWQVSGQATLGTAADFKGIILSQTLISLNTGAVLNGRALAQSEVTLIANTITKPN